MMVSLPPPPIRISLPPPPLSTLAMALPIRTSFPEPPVALSINERWSPLT